jgi:hypothetical protein
MTLFGLIDSSTEELPYAHTLIKIKDKKKKPDSKATKRKKTVEKSKHLGKKKKTTNDIEDENNGENNDEEEEEDDDNNEDDEDVLISEDDGEQATNVDVDLTKFSVYFRDFDLAIINFVNLELDFKDEGSSTAAQGSFVDIRNTKCKLRPQLLYTILTDFNQKASVIFKISSGKSFGGGSNSAPQSASVKTTKSQIFLQLNSVDANELAKHLVDNCFDR